MTFRLLTAFALICVAALAGCHSRTVDIAWQPACDTEAMAIDNAAYQAQLADARTIARNRLYSSSLAPRNDSDRARVDEYEMRMRRVEGELQGSYREAVNACNLLESCVGSYPPGSSPYCDAQRAEMLTARSRFADAGHDVTALLNDVRRYQPVKDQPPLPPKDAAGADAGKPAVNREKDCPAVTGVLTVCSDDD